MPMKLHFVASRFGFLYVYAMLREREIQFREQVRSKIQFWNEPERAEKFNFGTSRSEPKRAGTSRNEPKRAETLSPFASRVMAQVYQIHPCCVNTYYNPATHFRLICRHPFRDHLWNSWIPVFFGQDHALCGLYMHTPSCTDSWHIMLLPEKTGMTLAAHCGV